MVSSAKIYIIGGYALKKIISLAVVVLLLLTMLPITSAAGVTVYVTVSIDGKLELAAAPVTVTELTVEAAIKAAHKAYYSGGESGYAADASYGAYILLKAWGIEYPAYVIVNDAPTSADAAHYWTIDEYPIKNGDNITISTTTNALKDTKAISLTAEASGKYTTVTVMEWILDTTTYEYSSQPYPNAAITDPKTGTLLGTTNNIGEAQIIVPAGGVVAADGFSAIYISPAAVADPTPVTVYTVALSSQAVKVNGVATAFEVYNINGSNYFKLRDLAYVLNGTKSQFSVDFDQAKQAISCVKGAAYTANSTELNIGEDKSASAVPSAQSLFIDGAAASLTAFNIGGNNFFKLRDLGTALGFNVDYDDATRTMLITSVS
jgi:hypothetical protein